MSEAGDLAILTRVWADGRSAITAELDAIDAAGAALLAGSLDAERSVAAITSAHRLAGSLGTFGLPAGSALAGEIETLLAIRFVLRLLGANAQAGFAQLIYGVTGPLVAPFQGLFGTVQSDASVLESSTVVALLIYALVAWLVVKLAWLALGETRSATATTTHSTRIRP